MIELRRLHRDQKDSTVWLDETIERIRRMSHRHGGNPDGLVEQVWKLYAEKAPSLGLWIGVDDGQIVGHMLAFVQQYDGRWVVWLTQVETDHSVDRHMHDLVMATLDDFAHTFNFLFKNQGIVVDEILMTTPHLMSDHRGGAARDVWDRFAGFQRYREVRRRPLRSK